MNGASQKNCARSKPVQLDKLFREELIKPRAYTSLRVRSFGRIWSGFLICGVPFKQIHFQVSDLSNPLWTRIHRITDLRNQKTDHWIIDLTRFFGPRIISGNRRKQVSVCQHLYKQVKLCKLIINVNQAIHKFKGGLRSKLRSL